MTKLTNMTKPIRLSQIKREWYEVDVSDKILGRITSKIAFLLQGKHKTCYVPHLDCGDYVVVINASKVKLSGKKAQTKIYTKYSGYPGGLKKATFAQLKSKDASVVLKHAVKGMLPKNKLRDIYLRRLYIFSNDIHPYKNKVKLVRL